VAHNPFPSEPSVEPFRAVDPPPSGPHQRRSAGAPGDAGSAVVVAAAVLAIAAVLAVGVVRVGGVVTDRARAHTAADAAALAGAAEGREAAVEVADANGGALVEFVDVGEEVEVTVRIGDVEAVARARLSW
jgi:hypothetical protein